MPTAKGRNPAGSGKNRSLCHRVLVFNVLDIEGFTAEMFREDKPENIPARIEE